MTVFVDTSALYAVLDRDDDNHAAAAERWTELVSAGAVLLTTNYVVIETAALVQHRLGMKAVSLLFMDVAPVLSVQWVNEADHRAAVAALLAAGRRKLSLVDCTSFQVMRRLGQTTALAFDRHFKQQGFTTVP